MITNWAGNISFGMKHLRRPTTVADLQDLVAASHELRVIGSGHSFNDIADTPGDLISVADLPQTVEVSDDGRSARVSAGMTYGAVAAALQAKGFALHNMGSLPHISVAGACATGTHGSGVTNGSLPTAVSAVEMVTADGSLATVSRTSKDFGGSVLSLGCLGVVTHLTLDIQPTYDIEQLVFLDLPRDELVAHFDEIMAAAYSVSVFTSWQSDLVDHVWLKRRDWDEQLGGTWHGAVAATEPTHPIRSLPADAATGQLGVRAPWNERLAHFRMDFTPSSGDELQTEYFVPHAAAADAIIAVEGLRDQVVPLLQISEIRTVAADEMWLSPAYERDSVALHFTWVNDTRAVLPVVTAVETALAPFDARPHWGKVFTMAPGRVRSLLPRFAEFQALQAGYDPEGKFRNVFVDRFLSPG